VDASLGEAHSSISPILSSLAWIPHLELCPRARGNSTLRTPSRCWISGPSSSSSAASLDRSPDNVYTPNVCRTAEVLPLVALGFIDLFDYTTSMSASVVSIDNVCAERLSTLVLQRYEYCRYSITLQQHRIDHGKGF
jgi:hypothetical protein